MSFLKSSLFPMFSNETQLINSITFIDKYSKLNFVTI